MKKKFPVLMLCMLLLLTLSAACAKKEGSAALKNAEALPFQAYSLDDGEEKTADLLKENELNLCVIWQPGCPPCEAELRFLEEESKSCEGVAVIPLGIAESLEAARETAENWQLQSSAFYCGDDFFQYLKEEKNLERTPTLYFLDAEACEKRPAMQGFSEENKEEIRAFLSSYKKD